MNYPRAFLFAIFLWAFSFAMYGLTTVVPVLATGSDVKRFIVYWIFVIPVMLLLAKWYFRKAKASFRTGLGLGVLSIALSLLFDLISFMPRFMSGGAAAGMVLLNLYTSWQFLVTVLIIVGVSGYAGFEFDTTFAEPGKQVK